MVALLIKGGADPLGDCKPTAHSKIKKPLDYAESFAKDKKAKFQTEAKVMVEIMKDPKKLEVRCEAVDVRIAAQEARETVLMWRYLYFLILMAFGVFGYLKYVKGITIFK